MKRHVICGDINIDRNVNNDPQDRNDIKALASIWEEFISDNDLTQLNFKPTWHMPGKKPSLLDLYYTNCPNLIDGVANVLNLLSEHDGVIINLHTQEKLLKTQFDTIRKYENQNNSEVK